MNNCCICLEENGNLCSMHSNIEHHVHEECLVEHLVFRNLNFSESHMRCPLCQQDIDHKPVAELDLKIKIWRHDKTPRWKYGHDPFDLALSELNFTGSLKGFQAWMASRRGADAL